MIKNAFIYFRKPYKLNDFQFTTKTLSVKKDTYSLCKIKQLYVRKLSLKDNIVNMVSWALVLSAVTWAFVPQFGFLTFPFCILFAFLFWKKYEIKAEFLATDETGDYWVSIAIGYTDDDFEVFKKVKLQYQQSKLEVI